MRRRTGVCPRVRRPDRPLPASSSPEIHTKQRKSENQGLLPLLIDNTKPQLFTLKTNFLLTVNLKRSVIVGAPDATNV